MQSFFVLFAIAWFLHMFSLLQSRPRSSNVDLFVFNTRNSDPSVSRKWL